MCDYIYFLYREIVVLMKKIFLSAVCWLLCLMSIVLSWCSFSPSYDTTTDIDDQSWLHIVTSFAPIYAHVQSIVGDEAIVTNLVPLGQSVHTRQISPQQRIALEQADLVFINGVELEHFLEPLLDELWDKVIDTSSWVSLLLYNEEEHEEEEHEEEEHEHGLYDPHYRLDPQQTLTQVDTIRDALISIDAENSSLYQRTTQVYKDLITAIDVTTVKRFGKITPQPYIMLHDAYQYYTQQYHLDWYQQESLIDFHGDSISLKELESLVSSLNNNDIRIIFTDPDFPSSTLDQLTDMVPWLIVHELNPLGKTLDADGYIDTLIAVADWFSSAFSALSSDDQE